MARAYKTKKLDASEKKRLAKLRSKAAKKGWEKRRAEEKRRSEAAKKAAKTRAKNKRQTQPKKQTKLALAKKLRQLEKQVARLQALKDLPAKERKKLATKKEIKVKEGRLTRERERALTEEAIRKAKVRHLLPEEARKAQEKAWPELRAQFREVIAKAQATGEIPSPKSFGRYIRRETSKSRGLGIHLLVEKEINEPLVEDILYRVGRVSEKLADKAKKRFGLWYATVALSAFGRKPGVGSGGFKNKSDPDPIRRMIQLEGYVSTGAQEDIGGMLSTLRTKLEETIDEGTVVLVRYVSVNTLAVKTNTERQAWFVKHPRKFKSKKKKRK